MRYLLIFILILSNGLVFAQSDIRFSQIHVAKGLINPGAYGSEADLSFDLIYRNQWTTQKGTPSTFGFTGSYVITPSHSIGVNFIYDQVGIAKSNQFLVGYAYKLNFNDEQSLSFGANVGFENITNDYSSIFVIEQGDQVFQERFSNFRFQAGFGMYYNGPKMYLGYSIPFLFNNVNFGEQNGIVPKLWHHYLTAGFYAESRKGNYTFNPTFQVKYVPNAPIQGDILLRNIFHKTFSINLGYRSSNAVTGGFDFMFGNMFRLGYSLNYNMNRFVGFAGTSHEVHLGFGYPYYYQTNNFNKKKYLNKGGFTKNYQQKSKKYRRR